MTKEQLAEILNGRPYGDEIKETESIQARKDGLLVVFGYSDDNTEFRGAFDDEVGCYDEKEIFVNRKGVLSEHEECECPFCGYEEAKKNAASIMANFRGPGPFHWKTEVPHSTFEIIEDGDVYCRGIVLSISDLPASK
jgi:hypothetical protein